MTDIGLLVLHALWFIAPAYATNGFPPLMQGKRPLDRGKFFGKQRLLGDGKTWEGTIGGLIVGLVIGALQIAQQHQLDYLGLSLPVMTLPLVIALCAGTMTGDILGSFAKRRLGIRRGDSALLMDQLGFLLVAFAFASAVHALDFAVVVALLVITPPVHWVTNVLGYWMKFKKKPW